VGDLDLDTRLDGGDGAYTMTMSRDWEIWGPQGGYVAAIALRAAGAHCRRPRPASIVGHFLGVASFDAPVSVVCTTLRRARVAESVRVSLTQADRPIFEALVWGIDDDVPRLEHDDAPAPDVPPWRDLATIQERLGAIGEHYSAFFPFWNNFEQRPTEFRNDWMTRTTGDHPPRWQQWLRYVPTASFADAWLDACRTLILVDVGSWPAATSYHNQQAILAPSIDLACEFHRIAPATDWLLVDAHSPSAADGLVASHQHVFSDDGVLLASGVSQLLCRATSR
jgi:acyl-CoA thioesterase II